MGIDELSHPDPSAGGVRPVDSRNAVPEVGEAWPFSESEKSGEKFAQSFVPIFRRCSTGTRRPAAPWKWFSRIPACTPFGCTASPTGDRKSTRLNSSHVKISYAVFCLKK